MKKILTIVLSLALCMSVFAACPSSAFAATMKKAPEYKVGDTITLKLSVKEKRNYHSSAWKDAYYAKFIPTADGDYEFDCSSLDFYGQGGYQALITDSKDNVVSFAYALGEDSYYIDIVGHLKKGETYYYLVRYFADVEHSVTLKVKLKKHKHQMIDPTEECADAEYMIDYEPGEGEPKKICKVQGCYNSGVDAYNNRYTLLLSKTEYTYNGKEKKPAVVAEDMRGKRMDTSALNLKIRYENNVKVGTGRVKINDNGYGVDRTFKINPQGTALQKLTAKKRGFTVKWNKQTTQTSGYQIQYATNSKFSKNKKTVKISDNKVTSKTFKKLKAKKKYYVRIRTYKTVNGKKYYSAWSKAKKVVSR